MNKRAFFINLLWFGLALLLYFFSGGDTPFGPAVWLWPVLLLRFFRETKKPVFAYLTAIPCMTIINILSSGKMMPMPFVFKVIFIFISLIVSLIPFLMDAYLSARLKNYRHLLFPTLAVSVEFLFSLFGGSGTWGISAYGVRDIALLQLASVTGVWGISFFLFWTASILNEVWEKRTEPNKILKPLIPYITVLIIIYGFGHWRIIRNHPEMKIIQISGLTPDPEMQKSIQNTLFMIMQNDAPSDSTLMQFRDATDKMFQTLISRSSRAAECGTEIVVWSEGACFFLESDEDNYIRIARETTQKGQFYLGLAAAVISDDFYKLKSHSEPFIKNKLILITPQGDIAWSYSKSILVPGMETALTIPGDGRLKSVSTARGTITGAICYEMDFPSAIRQAGKSEASLLLAPSNDWAAIKNTHALMARMRAIENGTALFRPTGEGISIAADPLGYIISQVDYSQSNGASLTAVLPVKHLFTIYTVTGDLFAWLNIAAGFVLLAIGFFRRKK